MTISELQHFRDLLVERERNLNQFLTGPGSPNPEDLRRVQGLVEDIKQALGRIEDGTYGTCQVCREGVELYRLEVQPATEICLGCISQEEKNRLEEELYLASKIHRALLPQTIQKIDGFDTAARALAARSVGGDYYDFLPTANGPATRIVIADTMGKGIPAGLLMANVQGVLRILAGEIASPSKLMTRLNQWLCRNIPVTNFISMVSLTVETGVSPNTGLIYTNAGHCPPLLLRANGDVGRLEPNGGVLGVHQEFTYSESSAQMESGDLLLLYTDGVTEALSSGKELFGENRLTEYLKTHQQESASALLTGLLEKIHGFTGKTELDDDLTVIALRKL